MQKELQSMGNAGVGKSRFVVLELRLRGYTILCQVDIDERQLDLGKAIES